MPRGKVLPPPLPRGDKGGVGQSVKSVPAITLDVECGACHARAVLSFVVAGDAGDESPAAPVSINSTDRPSRLLDVGQWIVLARGFLERVDRMKDKSEVRLLRLSAASCLAEAIKFYDDAENDLPPTGAFFTEVSRSRFHEAPEQFSRQRLLGLLSRLPAPGRTTVATDRNDPRPWWIRWA